MAYVPAPTSTATATQTDTSSSSSDSTSSKPSLLWWIAGAWVAKTLVGGWLASRYFRSRR